MIKIADNIFDSVIFKSYSGIWIQVSSFKHASDINKLTPIDHRVLRMSQRISRIIFFQLILKLIYLGYKFIDQIRYKDKIINIKKIISSSVAILYDIHEENAECNAVILMAGFGVSKFSMRHGININQDPIKPKLFDERKRGKVRVYLFSEYEKEFYRGSFGLRDEH